MRQKERNRLRHFAFHPAATRTVSLFSYFSAPKKVLNSVADSIILRRIKEGLEIYGTLPGITVTRNYSTTWRMQGGPMNEIIFQVLQDEIDGGYSASALGLGIHTEAETVDELRVNIREAVACHFDNSHETPKLVRL